jgi:hypothetical protein
MNDVSLDEVAEVLRRWHASKTQFEIVAALCHVADISPEEYAKGCRQVLNEGLTALRREKDSDCRLAAIEIANKPSNQTS